MTLSRRNFLKISGAAALALGVTPEMAALWRAPTPDGPAQTVDPLLHLLNRLAYGVRPEDYVHAQQMGY